MFRSQPIADALDQSDLNLELNTYAKLSNAGLESDAVYAEINKYPATHELISILYEADMLTTEHRQILIDVLFACKTITRRENNNSTEEFACLVSILRLLKDNKLLIPAFALKVVGDVTAQNELSTVYQALQDADVLTRENVAGILDKGNRFSFSM